MKIIAVSYASGPFVALQQIWAASARKMGFDEVRALGPSALDADFASAHAEVLAQPRGDGFWLWKPYLIRRALQAVEPGDVVVYSDAAMQFVNPIDPVIGAIDAAGHDVFLAGEGFVERRFTKRDAFVLTGCDAPRFTDSPQRFASVVAVRRTPSAERLVDDYLTYATDPRILTDMPNVMGEPDYPEFVDHRHDQSVLSLMSKRHGIEVVPNRLVAEGLAERDDQVMNHSRIHYSPAEVAAHLVTIGVLSSAEVSRFGTDRHLG